MSCHDIGRGLNEVVRMVISQYDKGEIDRQPAIRIIATCGEAVNWCDGNTTEALYYIRNCRCGKCLKLIPKGEKLLSLWDLPSGYDDVIEKARLATDRVCEECFDAIMPKYCLGDDDVGSLKLHILETNSLYPENCESEGRHPEDNVGFRWARDVDWYD